MNSRKWYEPRRNYPPGESSPHTFSSSTLIEWNLSPRFAAVNRSPRTTSSIGDGIKWRIKQRLKSHAEATFYIRKQQHSQHITTYSKKSTLGSKCKLNKFVNLDMHLNVLFIEYVAWLCVTSAVCKRRYSM